MHCLAPEQPMNRPDIQPSPLAGYPRLLYTFRNRKQGELLGDRQEEILPHLQDPTGMLVCPFCQTETDVDAAVLYKSITAPHSPMDLAMSSAQFPPATTTVIRRNGVEVTVNVINEPQVLDLMEEDYLFQQRLDRQREIICGHCQGGIRVREYESRLAVDGFAPYMNFTLLETFVKGLFWPNYPSSIAIRLRERFENATDAEQDQFLRRLRAIYPHDPTLLAPMPEDCPE